MMYVGTGFPPIPPVTGQVRYDEANNLLQTYDGSTWQYIGPSTDMEPMLITSNVKFGNTTFYIVEAKNYDWDTVYSWAGETFGPPSTDRDNFNRRWFVSAGLFYFHDSKNRDWFVMRWSGHAPSP